MAKMLRSVKWCGNISRRYGWESMDYLNGSDLNRLRKRYQQARKLFPKGKKRIPFREFLPAYGFYGEKFSNRCSYPMVEGDMERVRMLEHPNWVALTCIWALRRRKRPKRKKDEQKSQT